MAAERPFASRAHLLGAAAERWWHLEARDWHEAFGHHPRIGADPETLRARFARTADWSAREQAGAAGAAPETLSALAEGNRAYEERFGHVFLICASGLSAETMLAALKARIGNEPATELRIAAGEQAKITRLRLLALGGG
jgi:2-oxo-4-hydroxy-4-carboxy-5-ureidoimidazoline decarboxylase